MDAVEEVDLGPVPVEKDTSAKGPAKYFEQEELEAIRDEFSSIRGGSRAQTEFFGSLGVFLVGTWFPPFWIVALLFIRSKDGRVKFFTKMSLVMLMAVSVLCSVAVGVYLVWMGAQLVYWIATLVAVLVIAAIIECAKS